MSERVLLRGDGLRSGEPTAFPSFFRFEKLQDHKDCAVISAEERKIDFAHCRYYVRSAKFEVYPAAPRIQRSRRREQPAPANTRIWLEQNLLNALPAAFVVFLRLQSIDCADAQHAVGVPCTSCAASRESHVRSVARPISELLDLSIKREFA